MGNCQTVVDEKNEIKRPHWKSVYPIIAANDRAGLQRSALKSDEAQESNVNATAEEKNVRRIKILVSVEEYNELVSQGHSQESIGPFLVRKMEVQETNSSSSPLRRHNVCVNFSDDKQVSSWKPSLEAISED